MRPGSALPPALLPISPGDDWLPPDETATSVAHADAQQFQPHDARSVVPRIARPPRQPPRLPAHRTPMPGTYTDPKTLLAAFGGTTARAEGRAVLIRSAQVMLDELASQEAARAAAVALDSLAELAPPLAAGAILLRPEPAGAGEEQALRHALVELRAKGQRSFDMPPPSPPLPGLVPPDQPRRKPGESGFTPSPPAKRNPGYTPALPPVLVRPGRPTTENKPIILDSRKDEPSYNGETELSRILVPGGKRVGWVEGSNKNVRTVTPDQFEKIKQELLQDARELQTDESYDGDIYELSDGEIFGIRMSVQHGITIDIHYSKTTRINRNFKVHQNAP
ncbi:hypothetical protein [Acidisoma silvae]|uniref:Uncharacterized protein n=1 Tax=Acidisoma silvae TaxID=2802396 RepID=A0A963YT31_9PROT|nr:hypothetical protein [Acidisoma silvae]MCB8876553.1 hypothetical protein [Acidisoma silvae]